MVCAAWVGGLALWGRPDALGRAGLPVFNFVVIVVLGVPAMCVSGLIRGWAARRADATPPLATAVWIVAIAALAYATSFIHFGGFCLDPGDICVVRWPSRVAGLGLALGVLGGGALVEAATRAVRRRHGLRTPG